MEVSVFVSTDGQNKDFRMCHQHNKLGCISLCHYTHCFPHTLQVKQYIIQILFDKNVPLILTCTLIIHSDLQLITCLYNCTFQTKLLHKIQSRGNITRLF
jgi:hypothetical protein